MNLHGAVCALAKLSRVQFFKRKVKACSITAPILPLKNAVALKCKYRHKSLLFGDSSYEKRHRHKDRVVFYVFRQDYGTNLEKEANIITSFQYIITWNKQHAY